jgi:hypothetical protein
LSYQNTYPQFSTLVYTPELGYLTYKSKLTPITALIADVYVQMNEFGLFSEKLLMDILLGTKNASDAKFEGQVMKNYLSFLVIQGTYGGMFASLTPKQIIEGYLDTTLVNKLAQQPIYQGGNILLSGYYQVNVPEAVTPVGSVYDAFFTGEDDFKLTRTWAKFNGKQTVSVNQEEYLNNTQS